MNELDREGYTPLHLAVRSVDAIESCRPVRALLIKGARIDVKDYKGRMPFDYLREVKSKVFQRELVSLLRRNQSNCYVVSGTMPIQKVERSRSTIIAFYVLFSVTVLAKFLQLYPR